MSSSRKCAMIAHLRDEDCYEKLFHARGPAAAKLLSSNVLYVRGTAHDLSVDKRSRRLGPSETKLISSAKYGGAWPDKDKKTQRRQYVSGQEPVHAELARYSARPLSGSSEKSSSGIDGLNFQDEAVRHAVQQ